MIINYFAHRKNARLAYPGITCLQFEDRAFFVRNMAFAVSSQLQQSDSSPIITERHANSACDTLKKSGGVLGDERATA
jgi:hypothetical protein